MFRLLLLFWLLCPLCLAAQLQKGSFLLAGNGALSVSAPSPTIGSGAGDRVWRAQGSTQVGYFLDDVFCLGAQIDMDYLQQNNLNYRYTALLISPFMRFYVEKIFFLEAAYGIGQAWERTPSQQLTAGVNQLALGGGLCLFLSERVSLEPQFFYLRSFIRRVPRDNTVILGFGISLYLAKPKLPSMQGR